MPGGVGGAAPRGAPLSRSTSCMITRNSIADYKTAAVASENTQPTFLSKRNSLPSHEASNMLERRRERHRTGKAGWLRAAVLGADDGILSTASLVLGVAAAHGSRGNLLIAGVAGLVAG